MPTLRQYVNGRGYYIRARHDGHFVTYQVSHEGVGYLEGRGLKDRSNVDQPTLCEMIDCGLAFTHGSGSERDDSPSPILDNARPSPVRENKPQSETRQLGGPKPKTPPPTHDVEGACSTHNGPVSPPSQAVSPHRGGLGDGTSSRKTPRRLAAELSKTPNTSPYASGTVSEDFGLVVVVLTPLVLAAVTLMATHLAFNNIMVAAATAVVALFLSAPSVILPPTIVWQCWKWSMAMVVVAVVLTIIGWVVLWVASWVILWVMDHICAIASGVFVAGGAAAFWLQKQ